MLHDLTGIFSGRVFWLIQVLFFLVSLALLLTMGTDTPFTAGADASTWINPAKAPLAQHNFVLLNQPDIVDVYRPPLVPLFNAFFLWMSPSYGYQAIVIAQLILLSLTATLAGLMANRLIAGTGLLSMVLVLFNPNSLSTALLLQSENLSTFLLALACACLFFAIENQSWRYAAFCAIALAMATLCRPVTQYLIVLLPLIFATLILFRYNSYKLAIKGIFMGAGASALAIGLLIPWLFFVAKVEGSPALVSSELSSIYVRDQLITLESYSSGASIKTVSDQMKNDESGMTRHRCEGLILSSAERAQCFSQVLDANWKSIRSYHLLSYSKALYRSTLGFFISGASGNWHKILLQKQNVNMTEAWNSSDQQNGSVAFVKSLLHLDIIAVIITMVCVTISIVLKLLSLLGLTELWRKRDFISISVFVGLISYFMATTLFLGQSRYRVPIEPYFAVLASIGCFTIVNFVKKLKIKK